MSFEEDGERQRLRALAHPVRLRILSLLTDSPKSGTQLGPELGMSQAAVSYHLRSLAEAGLVEVAETRSVRGGLEKLYRPMPIGTVAGRSVDMVASAAAITAEVQRRVSTLAPRTWDVLSDAEIWVSEESWTRCARAIADAMVELHAAAAEPQTPGTVHVSATTMLFRPGSTPKARASRKPRRTPKSRGG